MISKCHCMFLVELESSKTVAEAENIYVGAYILDQNMILSKILSGLRYNIILCIFKWV